MTEAILAAADPALASAEAAHGAHGGALALINDLGVVLVTAALTAVIFSKLRLPLIFGYLVAGLLVGPNLLPLSPVNDLESVQALSELGVIFLLFFIGLEFDLRRLQRMLAPAFIAVLLQTALMIATGLGLAGWLGWSSMSGIFLGSLLAISSSMVTIAVLQAHGQLDLPHGQLAVGILIFEDILAVLLLVVLAGFAVQDSVVWGSVWTTALGIGVFVVAIYYFGRLLAPPVLDFLNRLGSRELVTVVSVATALGISVLAAKLDFSVGLGAFVAGSILSSSRLSEEIERTIQPLRDLFGAVFFVSVGMLIQPERLAALWLPVLLLSLLVILGKGISCHAGMFLAGERPRRSFRAALAKTQIGEFSFVIASLGAGLGVTHPDLMSLTVGVALITILLTPTLESRSEMLYHVVAGWIPKPLNTLAERYRGGLERMAVASHNSEVVRAIRRPALQSIVYTLLIAGLLISGSIGASAVSRADISGQGTLAAILLWPLMALAIAPFLVALLGHLNAIAMVLIEAALGRSPWQTSGRFRNLLGTSLVAVVLVPFGIVFYWLSHNYLPRGAILGVFGSLVLLLVGFFYGRMARVSSRIENRFQASFRNSPQEMEAERRREILSHISRAYPWPVNVRDVVVRPEARAAGRRISELGIREKTGATIVAVCRGRIQKFDPDPQVPIFPGDRLVLLGEEQETADAETLLQKPADEAPASRSGARFEVHPFVVPRGSMLDGETLAGADLRRQYGVTVVGVQRGADRISSPAASHIIRGDDVIMLVGESGSLKRLEQALDPGAQRTER